jgi:hypothetical protein
VCVWQGSVAGFKLGHARRRWRTGSQGQVTLNLDARELFERRDADGPADEEEDSDGLHWLSTCVGAIWLHPNTRPVHRRPGSAA